MESSYYLAIIMIMAIAMTQTSPCHAGEIEKEFLDLHNQARAAIGVPPVYWNASLEAYAKNFAAQQSATCIMMHSGSGRFQIGENVAMSPTGMMTVPEAVESWSHEKAFYDHQSETCTGGKECHHYTNMVFNGTTGIGCALVKCASNRGSFASCNYYPGLPYGVHPY